MGDPFALFAQATESKQSMLRTVWPEMHDLLAKLDGPAAEHVLRCAVYVTHPIGSTRKATRRLTENGHPACRPCIDEACDILHGYPLKRVKPTS